MPDHKENICPNCNNPADGNYCSHCGQSTHLHKDTFGSLVSHFISHYLHFESKFWKTLKALIVHPGRLDRAYYNKQRARYTEPVSLYIFISVVFFIVAAYAFKFRQTTEVNPNDKTFTMTHEWTVGFYNRLKGEDAKQEKWLIDYNCDSLRKVRQNLKDMNDGRRNYFKDKDNQFSFSYEYLFVTFYNFFVYPYAYRHHMYDVDEPVSEIYNEFFHLLPKIFFLLMPLLALMLYMLFFRDKRYKFANYAVLSLHTHCFMFLSGLVLMLVVGSVTDASTGMWLFLFLVVIPLVHFLFTCRNFFGKNWVYTAVVGTITWAMYLALVVLIAITILLLMVHFS